MEADEAGVLYKILVSEGDVKIVGELIAVMGDSGVSADAVAEFVANL